jgi:hypothetical protein
VSTEPCGSLPVTTWNVQASYCHHHEAWHASTSTTHQTSDAEVRVIHHRSATFGPFDAWDDVTEWVGRHLLDPSVTPLT